MSNETFCEECQTKIEYTPCWCVDCNKQLCSMCVTVEDPDDDDTEVYCQGCWHRKYSD